MKKSVILRILGIGMFHAVLYLYVVPFMIYPKFGNNGIRFAVVVAIIVSIAVLGTILIEKKINKRRKK